jgi:hypothetical protein
MAKISLIIIFFLKKIKLIFFLKKKGVIFFKKKNCGHFCLFASLEKILAIFFFFFCLGEYIVN